ncbi:GNAT family N-acetyltransferase [Microbacterium sp. NPDC096154]|uniref:GNAT family N-acetyltransferase n=1 Tax=Microbacterium sp. NPDC096154 TaxID=3155549 RepID=UPI00332AD23D
MSQTLGTTAAGLRIEALRLPASIDAPDAADYLTATRLMSDALCADSGTDLFRVQPAEWLVALHSTRYTERLVSLARQDGEIAGVLVLEYQRNAERTATVEAHVPPRWRGAGIEEALFAEADRLAAEHGRSLLHAWNLVLVQAPGRRLVSPTGVGSVPADAESTRRLQRLGYTLGQVERVSTFEFATSLPRAERMLRAALDTAGDEYRAVWWHSSAPDELVDAYAAAVTRMATDVPAGELEFEEDPWDAERIRYRERLKAEAGQTMAVAAVVHAPTGTVAAFNELVLESDRTRPAMNYGTLVLPEHRGRRLGTIVKCVGLIRFHDMAPECPRAMTFNAEENRYMLDVNEAVGFVPAAYSGEWKKEL